MTMYCCGAVPSAAAVSRDLALGRAVLICTGGCRSSDALLCETRTRKVPSP